MYAWVAPRVAFWAIPWRSGLLLPIRQKAISLGLDALRSERTITSAADISKPMHGKRRGVRITGGYRMVRYIWCWGGRFRPSCAQKLEGILAKAHNFLCVKSQKPPQIDACRDIVAMTGVRMYKGRASVIAGPSETFCRPGGRMVMRRASSP